MSPTLADDPNPFINDDDAESTKLNPAAVALPESTMYEGAEPYPQDQPSLPVNIDQPSSHGSATGGSANRVQDQGLARDRSASVASSLRPPRDAIQVSTQTEVISKQV